MAVAQSPPGRDMHRLPFSEHDSDSKHREDGHSTNSYSSSKPVDVPLHVNRYSNLTPLELSEDDVKPKVIHQYSSSKQKQSPPAPPPPEAEYVFEEAVTYDEIRNEPLSEGIIKKNDTFKLYNIKYDHFTKK